MSFVRRCVALVFVLSMALTAIPAGPATAAVDCAAIGAGANLSGCDLSGANLTGAFLYDATLDDANLNRANLSGAHLVNASLRWANLNRANLSFARLASDSGGLLPADLTGANLNDVTWLITLCPNGSDTSTNGLGYCTAETVPQPV